MVMIDEEVIGFRVDNIVDAMLLLIAIVVYSIGLLACHLLSLPSDRR